MDMGIAGRWALVGGASKGLGLACAQALFNEGVHVVMVARTPEALQKSATNLIAALAQSTAQNGKKAFENQVLTLAADITTPEGREAIWALPGGPGKSYDIVVTNAGGPPPGDFRNWGQAEWHAAIEANMLTPIELIKATVDGMAERGFGRVVNITSAAVKSPIDVLGLSNGARAGLTGFVAGVARSSLAASGVTINNLLPGPFETDRLNKTLEGAAQKSGQSLEAVRTARMAANPARRFGQPAEFGATCAFLCSSHAGYINGQNILMDGGAFNGTL